MKKLMILAALLALSVGGYLIAGDGHEGKHADAPTTAPSTQPAEPINKICPVHGGDVDAKVTTVYDGKIIGFCCEDCIAEFNKDPEKYMKDLK